jgi:putative aldouronate transport system substrate-binding protein
MAPRINRRAFVSSTAAGVAGLGVARSAGAGTAPSSQASPATHQVASPAASPVAMTLEEYLQPVPGKHDPAVLITTVAVALPTVSYDPGDDINNNQWTRAYEQKYGIDVQYEWAVPPDQYEQRVNLMLTSGDLPDYLAVSATQFQQLVDNDSLEDLTDVYEQHATDRVKQIITDTGTIPMQAATVDGRQMSIPNVTVAKEGAAVLWVRSDWLEKLGLPEPTTMDNLLQISEAFATQDPDGNGSGDTFGLAIDNEFSAASGFFAGYHAYRSIWMDDGSGQLVYSSIQPEMKTALEQLQAMHASGQIDREFGVKTGSQLWEDFIAGRSGLWYGSVYSGVVPIGDVKRQDPDSEWTPYAIPSIDDSPALPLVGAGLTAGREHWVVRKGFQHAADILTMIDFWVETFYENTNDEIYRHFVQPTSDRAVWQMNAIQLVKPYKNLEQSNAIVEIIESGSTDLSHLTAEGRDNLALIQAWLNEGNIDGYGWDRVFGPTGAMQRVIKPYVAEDRFIQNAFFGAPTPTMVSRQSSLDTMELETFTKIVQGASIDEFDAFVDSWMQLGGEEITAEVNEWYQSQ